MNDIGPAVVIKEATVSFDGGSVLSPAPVSFEVPRRSAFVMISGPNGSGKSSLLRAILGMQDLHGGTIRWHVDLNRESVVVYQEDGLISSITVRQNLRIVRAGDHAILQELDCAGIGLKIDSYCGTLSGGEKRLVQMARARVSARHYWFLDEPTAEVDERKAHYVYDAVANHCRRGGVVVCATHDIAFTKEVARSAATAFGVVLSRHVCRDRTS